MEASWKSKNRTTIWSSKTTPGQIAKENDNSNLKKFIESLFTKAKIWKKPKCPLIDQRVKNMWYTYRHRFDIDKDRNR